MLLLVTSQMIGFGMAGMVRRFLVQVAFQYMVGQVLTIRLQVAKCNDLAFDSGQYDTVLYAARS